MYGCAWLLGLIIFAFGAGMQDQEWNDLADLNHDGRIDTADIGIVLWGCR